MMLGFSGQRSEMLAAGLDDHVGKPFRPDEIFDCMARQLGVRYRRAEALAASEGESAAALRPQDFATLPAELRTELTNAVISLDRERIARVIQLVSELNGPLAAVLAGHANRFAYTAMLKAIG